MRAKDVGLMTLNQALFGRQPEQSRVFRILFFFNIYIYICFIRESFYEFQKRAEEYVSTETAATLALVYFLLFMFS